METETTKLGARGTVVIPARLRKRFGLEEGALLIVEETERGLLLRPAMAVPVEEYSKARRAEFILNNVANAEEYAAARKSVQDMGLDPDRVPHTAPGAGKRGKRE